MRKVNLVGSLGRFSKFTGGFAFLFVVAFAGHVFSQQTKTMQAARGAGIQLFEPIPDVSETCVTVECNWWRELRKAGSDVRQKGNKKSRQKYVEVFLAGLENGYRVPIADRTPLLVVSDQPPQLPRHVRPKNGEVEISLEIREDGSVGEIKVINGLNTVMDNICVQSFKEGIYLPAIRDGSWIADSVNRSCKFWSLKGL